MGVVLDACMVITFGTQRRLDVVASLRGYEALVGSRADGEVLRDPARSRLDVALEHGEIRRVSIDLAVAAEQDALRKYDAMPAFRGRGDAEVLALAESRAMAVGSDDAAVQRSVRKELGPRRLLSSIDVLVLVVREGHLSLAHAERLLDRLDVGPHYQARLASAGLTLGDLV